jgi:ligand-binding sensor domain-containing protein
LIVYDPSTQKMTRVSMNIVPDDIIPSASVSSILVDFDSSIWNGSYQGLFHYNYHTGKFILCREFVKKNGGTISVLSEP